MPNFVPLYINETYPQIFATFSNKEGNERNPLNLEFPINLCFFQP